MTDFMPRSESQKFTCRLTCDAAVMASICGNTRGSQSQRRLDEATLLRPTMQRHSAHHRATLPGKAEHPPSSISSILSILPSPGRTDPRLLPPPLPRAC
ncbi:uncharacterized protein TrAFT101_000963 [Trichoderma asperellum]|uniref:uncharacterized protein n=1 Tax=Trichoderma asperellum TaxID=101201 RepID=UPI003324FADF|nr:hypothetical protein TrAFT101_000963 [Trichoderma asperellum]